MLARPICHNLNRLKLDLPPSLQKAVDEGVAAVKARPTPTSESPTPTGTTTEEVVAPSPVKQKLSNPAVIPLNRDAVQPSTILVRDDQQHAAAAKKQAEYRALEILIEAIEY